MLQEYRFLFIVKGRIFVPDANSEIPAEVYIGLQIVFEGIDKDYPIGHVLSIGNLPDQPKNDAVGASADRGIYLNSLFGSRIDLSGYPQSERGFRIYPEFDSKHRFPQLIVDEYAAIKTEYYKRKPARDS